ncbi:hypothetical protein RRG08_020604 [Elysia crispata]|uniref:Uncharacterized protein n=1 Tax=Elysia crispata TaxID=231223 RepID=A0AAE1A7I7_9GAST|nr:hypothetical protein RRG08_020604 [Elysia crispata]
MFQLPGRKEGLPIILHFWPVQGIGKLKSDDFNNTGLDQLKTRENPVSPSITDIAILQKLSLDLDLLTRPGRIQYRPSLRTAILQKLSLDLDLLTRPGRIQYRHSLRTAILQKLSLDLDLLTRPGRIQYRPSLRTAVLQKLSLDLDLLTRLGRIQYRPSLRTQRFFRNYH